MHFLVENIVRDDRAELSISKLLDNHLYWTSLPMPDLGSRIAPLSGCLDGPWRLPTWDALGTPPNYGHLPRFGLARESLAWEAAHNEDGVEVGKAGNGRLQALSGPSSTSKSALPTRPLEASRVMRLSARRGAAGANCGAGGFAAS